MLWAKHAWPAKTQNGRRDRLNEHVQHGHEEWKGKSKMLGCEHPFVIQGQYEREDEPMEHDKFGKQADFS
jgi:hypothetical protein